LTTYEIVRSNLGICEFAELFSILLEQPDYQRGFIAPEDYRQGVHGPFQVGKLRPDNFVPVTHEQFYQLIRSDLAQEQFTQAPSAEQQARLYSLLDSIITDETVFYLLDIERDDEKYVHDLWWILSIFREYILVDRSKDLLHVCIVGFD